jgi:hypothetical protein
MTEPFDQPGPFPEARKTMPLLPKVVLINLGIFLAYMIFFWVHNDESNAYSGLEDFVTNFLILVAQVAVNWIAGLVLFFNPKHKMLGKALLIGGAILAVVGLFLSYALEDYF